MCAPGLGARKTLALMFCMEPSGMPLSLIDMIHECESWVLPWGVVMLQGWKDMCKGAKLAEFWLA